MILVFIVLCTLVNCVFDLQFSREGEKILTYSYIPANQEIFSDAQVKFDRNTVRQVLNIDGYEIYILDNGHTILKDDKYGTIKDDENNYIGRIVEFGKVSQNENKNLRLLHEKNRKKRVVVIDEDEKVKPPELIEGQFNAFPSEMYCRYGCGNINGVTFPYYYRPFFGYGFPLIGSEHLFNPGYGGNPVTNAAVEGFLG